MFTPVHLLMGCIRKYTQIEADSWQIAIICYLCGMKQKATTPILEIVSRIVSIKADFNDVAFEDSINLILGEFGNESDLQRLLSVSMSFGKSLPNGMILTQQFPGYNPYVDTVSNIGGLHLRLQRELNSLVNTFATTDISTKDALESLRNMTANFCMQMYSAYTITDAEIDEGIEQYQMQIEITKKLIEALKIRKKYKKKSKEASANSKTDVYFRIVKKDVDELKVLYKNLCADKYITNTSEETFLYVFGGHTSPDIRVIRWESTLSYLVALLDTLVQEHAVWKIANACFEKRTQKGVYLPVSQSQLKTTRQRNLNSEYYDRYMDKIKKLCNNR